MKPDCVLSCLLLASRLSLSDGTVNPMEVVTNEINNVQ